MIKKNKKYNNTKKLSYKKNKKITQKIIIRSKNKKINNSKKNKKNNKKNNKNSMHIMTGSGNSICKLLTMYNTSSDSSHVSSEESLCSTDANKASNIVGIDNDDIIKDIIDTNKDLNYNGINNPNGKSCFMNSISQLFWSIPEVRDFLLKIDIESLNIPNQQYTNENNVLVDYTNTDIDINALRLLKIIFQNNSTNNKFYDFEITNYNAFRKIGWTEYNKIKEEKIILPSGVTELKSKILKNNTGKNIKNTKGHNIVVRTKEHIINNSFGNDQEDSQEFLNFMFLLFQRLKDNNNNNNDLNILVNSFFVNQITLHKCRNTNKTQVNTALSHIITIELNNINDGTLLSVCLNNMYQCEDKTKDVLNNKLDSCKDTSKNPEGFFNSVDGKMEIPDLNKNLLLSMKRYSYDTGVAKKLYTKIIPDKVLVINNSYFKLQGCIIHLGDDPRAGHYIYLIFDKDGNPDKIINDPINNQTHDDSYIKDGYIYYYRRFTPLIKI